MKKLFFLLIVLLIVLSTKSQPCLPDGIYFRNQAEIDSFQTNYPGCTQIEGFVYIGDPRGESNITNLNGLSVLTSIGGNLSIYFNALTSLTGLENLTSIGGSLSIGYNNSLASLTGLGNIDAGSITDLIISDNASLSNCAAQSICDYLANPNGTVNIYNNASGCNNPAEVANACGNVPSCLPYGNYYFNTQNEIDNFSTNYPGCTMLEGEVVINGVDITNLNGLSVLTSIAGSLNISENNNLTSLTGLEGLTFIEGDLQIGIWDDGNPALTSLTGLEGLTSVGNMGINSNIALTSLTGLEGLTSVGNIGIWGNVSLTSFTGLDNVTSITGGLAIGDNDALTSLTGLANLTSIGGFLSLIDNNALTSLTGFDNIDGGSIVDLHIQYNFSLSNCEVESICDYLASPNGTIFISDNATGCNSQEEVEAACGVGLDESAVISQQSAVRSYPNPSFDHTTFEYKIEEFEIVTLEIFNQLGQMEVLLVNEHQTAGTNQVTWNAEGMPAGIYYYSIRSGKLVQTGKIVIVK